MNCKPSLKPTLRAGRRKKRSSSPSRTGLYVCSLPPLLLLPPSPLWAHGHDPFPTVLTGRPETSRVPARQRLRSKPDFVPCAWEVPGLAAAMLRCLTEIHLPPWSLVHMLPWETWEQQICPWGYQGFWGSGMCPYGQRGCRFPRVSKLTSSPFAGAAASREGRAAADSQREGEGAPSPHGRESLSRDGAGLG